MLLDVLATVSWCCDPEERWAGGGGGVGYSIMFIRG